jgi:hypothetical protein
MTWGMHGVAATGSLYFHIPMDNHSITSGPISGFDRSLRKTVSDTFMPKSIQSGLGKEALPQQ